MEYIIGISILLLWGIVLVIMGIVTWVASVFSNPAYSNVLSALVGAILGSLSGYWFNRRLESSRTKERYLIQRKNTVYSPIYKQLLSLRQYLSDVNLNSNKSVNILLEESRYSDYQRNFNFIIWTDINKDVRKSYITTQQRTVMELLISKIHAQQKLQDKVRADIKSIVSPVAQKYSANAKSTVNINLIENTLSSYLEQYVFPYSHTTDDYVRQQLKTDLQNYYTISDDEGNKVSHSLLEKITKLPSYQSIEKSLQELIDANDRAIELFELMIRDIINKHEGGL